MRLIAATIIAAVTAITLASSGAKAWDIPYDEWEDDTPTPGQPTPAKPVDQPGGLAPAASKIVPIVHRAGAVVLPTTGARVDLPALQDGADYRISGRWGLGTESGSWSRDIIDEIRASALIGATWYFVGPFILGTCDAVLKSITLTEAWRETRTIHGQSFELLGGTFKFTGSLGERPAVVMCGGPTERPLLLYRFFFEPNAPKSLPKDVLLARLPAVGAIKAIIESHVTRRWSRVKPLLDEAVGGDSADRESVKKAQLKYFQGEVTLPEDGAVWLVRDFDTMDWFERHIPRFPSFNVGFGKAPANVTCDDEAAAMREQARRSGESFLPTVPAPAGWRAMMTIKLKSSLAETVLCRYSAEGWVISLIRHDEALGDVAEAEPLLTAFMTTVGIAPEPIRPTRPTPSRPNNPTPSPSHDRDLQDVVYASMDFGAAVSHRDSAGLGRDETRFPSTRIAGPGFGFEGVFADGRGGLLLRWSMGVLPDAMAAFDGDRVSSSRWGGQMWWAAADLGFSFGVSDSGVLGFSIGWHGHSGPLLLNSSAAVSAHYMHLPAEVDGLGFYARLTPLQLMPSNERWVMSPLSLDLRVAFEGISFGTEFQYVGAPAVGDEDIPGEGWAFIFRVGAGRFFF